MGSEMCIRDRSPISCIIVHRLRELLDANERGFRNYMNMLEILSENRDLVERMAAAGDDEDPAHGRH